MRASILLIIMLLFSLPAMAADADLAGEWRAQRDGNASPCGEAGKIDDVRFTLEFAFTGGLLAYDDGSEDAGSLPIKSVNHAGDMLAIAFKDGNSWSFKQSGTTLKSVTPPELWSSAFGRTFYQCQKPADRSAIKLDKTELAAIAADMPPGNAVFVDSRAKEGCKALDFQYVFFDLVGPLGFKAGRWNSTHVAETLAEDKPSPVASDEIANWSIDKAEPAPGGYKLTLTELIPPNGSRGDTSSITLVAGPDGHFSIPEWKRNFVRCTPAQLAHP